MDNKEIAKKKKLKKRGAIISGGLIVLYYTIMAFSFALSGLVMESIFAVLVLVIVPIILVVIVIKVTMDRINEIDGGEEDDISKY